MTVTATNSSPTSYSYGSSWWTSVRKEKPAGTTATAADSTAVSKTVKQLAESKVSSMFDSAAYKYVKGLKDGAAGVKNSLKALSSPVSSAPGGASEADKVKAFANSYNDLYKTVVGNAEDPKAERLFGELVGVSKTYKVALDRVGIGFDSDGLMKIDEEKLAKASESGEVSRLFAQNRGASYGFANRLSQLADRVTTNTGSYVSKNSFLTYSAPTSSASSLLATLFNFNSKGSILDFWA
jgi:hypothetical protein